MICRTKPSNELSGTRSARCSAASMTCCGEISPMFKAGVSTEWNRNVSSAWIASSY